MKKFIRSSVSILLAVFILVSGSGFVIGRMMCMHSGFVQYNLGEAKDCCGDSKENVIKGSCCALSNAFIKTDKFVSQNKVEIPQSFSFVTYSAPFVSIAPSFASELPVPTANAPPILSGTDLLHFISIQRI